MTQAKIASDKNVQMLQEAAAMSRNALLCLNTIAEPAACSLIHSASVYILIDIAVKSVQKFQDARTGL